MLLLCKKALVYAVDCHSGQFRKSGEPYIIHPIQVGRNPCQAETGCCDGCLWFLHDVVEDTDATSR